MVSLRRKVFAVIILFTLLSPCTPGNQPSKVERGGKRAAPSGAGSALIRVGDMSASGADIISFIEDDTEKRHNVRIIGAERVVKMSVEEMVRNFLVMSDLRDNYLDDPLYADYRAYLEDAVVDKHFRTKILPERLAVTRKELEDRLPRQGKEIRLRQITLSTWEEADEVRKRIESGEDFVELIRELDAGPERLQDGLYVDYVPETTPRFNRDDIVHLFSLKEGQYSRIMPTKIGFAICRVEGIRAVGDEEARKIEDKVRSAIYSEKVEKLFDVSGKSFIVEDLDKKDFYRKVQMHLQGKADHNGLAVFKTGDRELLLSTVIYVAERTPDPMPDLTFTYKISKYWKRALAMKDVLVGARVAQDSGIAISEQDRPRVDEFVMKNLLDFHYERQIGGVDVEKGEAEKFFEENPTLFFGRGSVELYDIQSGVKSIAEEVREKAIAGEDFASLARLYSIDRESAEEGGYRGVVKEGELDPEVADVAFSLNEGEISGVILSPSGFHVLKVGKKIPPATYTFDEREEYVVNKYRDMKREEKREEYISSLKEKYQVEVDWEGIEKVIEDLEEKKGKAGE